MTLLGRSRRLTPPGVALPVMRWAPGCAAFAALAALAACGQQGSNAASGNAASGTAAAKPSIMLESNPGSVVMGHSTTLNWNATGAQSCTASGGWSGSKAASGSQSTGALTSNQTYTLTCGGAGGSAAQSATVSVTTPAAAVTLTASPSTVKSGAPSTLTWSSTNATSCTASGGWTGGKAASGSQSTSALTATTTYTLTCSGAGGSAAQSAMVTVSASPPSGAPSGFTPAPGFSLSSQSAFSDGSSITVTGPAGSFGTKPYAAAPLLWAPMETQLNPSSLGRVTSWGAPNQGLTFSSAGGPTGRGAASGAGSPSSGGINTGANNWTLGFDIDQWSDAPTGYAVNSFGQKFYVYHYVWRNFGHLNGTGSGGTPSNYNTKNIRFWSRTGGIGSSEATPDMYVPPSNGRFTVEEKVDWLPSPDYNISQSLIEASENQTNTWYSEEFLTHSNSNASTADANIMWYSTGINSGEPFVSFPNTTYQENSWKFLTDATETSGGYGTMLRVYPAHYVVDGTDPSGRPEAPAGSYVQYAYIYVDDSWCRVMITNSSTYGSETVREIQIPSAWSDTSVTFYFRKGMLDSLSGAALWIIDNTNTWHYVGSFT